MTLGNSPVTLASAPGKVLVVGGYLVLDRAHSGLVVGTDTCLYAAIQTQVLDISVSATELSISVVSPQFDSAWWQYTFNTATGKLRQHASANDTSNRFVEVVLESTLALATEYVPEALRKLIAEENGLKIVLAADNDFYSQRTTLEKLGLQLSSESLRKIPRMGPTGTTLQGVHKTGLGSSAAMVTSLVAALLAHLGAVPMSSLDPKNHGTGESQQSLRLVHNIAQYAHCLAQGKIGSGFDVSSAVYGSHEYRRFSPSVLEDAMAQTSDTAAVKNAVSPKNAAWDNEATPVRIPPGFKLRLADVDAGSNTPSMVRKILQWKQSFPEKSSKLWQALHDANGQIRALWDKLNDAHESDPKDYDDAIAWCAEQPSSDWKCAPRVKSSNAQQLLVGLVEAIQQVRALQRELGENAGVPIEPPKQTRLLDACMQVPGICMAAVPGAGGYDAIYCVALSDTASQKVEELWSQWTEMSVGPLLANQASSGVCVLDPAAYPEITSKL